MPPLHRKRWCKKGMACGTVQCEACRKIIFVEPDDNGWENLRREANRQGFFLRYFTPTLYIWFCGHRCAYHSTRALEIASYWPPYRHPPDPETFAPMETYRT